MAGKSKPHVFLSHVREDAERIDRLASDLEARGIETWIDRHKIKPGQRWERAIEDAIRSGAFFVACFSSAYSGRTRTYMNEELQIAFQEVRLRPADTSWFIPVRLDECEIPDLRIAPELTVRSFQWLDMFPDWEKGVERLAEAIGPSSLPDHLREPLSAAEQASAASERSTGRGRSTHVNLQDTLALRDQAVPSYPEILRAGTVFRDFDAPWCPEMVVIPTGEFMMGSPEGEEGREEAEGPQHLVTIGYPLAVGSYPVTFEEYDYFVRVTRRELPSDEGWGRGRRPAINVSWIDAKAYTDWLSLELLRPYRLLSEAEWEYACRAGSTTRYWWGDEITPEKANYGDNVGKTSEVGAYPANLWGLYDTHGNAWEMVEDCWNPRYTGAPVDGRAWANGDCSHRVIRGGRWGNSPQHLRSARRNRANSGAAGRATGRSSHWGFRVARTL
jgi:formylglycine-generating enzyme required for sulfatase activity